MAHSSRVGEVKQICRNGKADLELAVLPDITSLSYRAHVGTTSCPCTR